MSERWCGYCNHKESDFNAAEGRCYGRLGKDAADMGPCLHECRYPPRSADCHEPPRSEYEREYERLFNWRDLWNRLSNSKRFKLASQNERIEEKAARANRLIGQLITDWDSRRAKAGQPAEADEEPPCEPSPPMNDAQRKTFSQFLKSLASVREENVLRAEDDAVAPPEPPSEPPAETQKSCARCSGSGLQAGYGGNYRDCVFCLGTGIDKNHLIADNNVPLCPVHQSLERNGHLELVYGNSCVACSLHERMELLDILSGFYPADGSEDSVTLLRSLIKAARSVPEAALTVEDALAELREMFPRIAEEDWLQVSGYYDSDVDTYYEIELGNFGSEPAKQFSGATLDLAMQQVRDWKEKQSNG